MSMLQPQFDVNFTNDFGSGPRLPFIRHSIHLQDISHLKNLPQKAKATEGKRHLKIIGCTLLDM